jgi:uncharacterized protein YuzE
MKYSYDSEHDVLAIDFREGAVYADSEEIYDGFVIDFDTSGKPMGLEVYQYASKFFDIPRLLRDFKPQPDPAPVAREPMYIRDAPPAPKKTRKKKS